MRRQIFFLTIVFIQMCFIFCNKIEQTAYRVLQYDINGQNFGCRRSQLNAPAKIYIPQENKKTAAPPVLEPINTKLGNETNFSRHVLFIKLKDLLETSSGTKVLTEITERSDLAGVIVILPNESISPSLPEKKKKNLKNF